MFSLSSVELRAHFLKMPKFVPNRIDDPQVLRRIKRARQSKARELCDKVSNDDDIMGFNEEVLPIEIDDD